MRHVDDVPKTIPPAQRLRLRVGTTQSATCFSSLGACFSSSTFSACFSSLGGRLSSLGDDMVGVEGGVDMVGGVEGGVEGRESATWAKMATDYIYI